MKFRQVSFHPVEWILELLARIGKWHLNLTDYTEVYVSEIEALSQGHLHKRGNSLTAD